MAFVASCSDSYSTIRTLLNVEFIFQVSPLRRRRLQESDCCWLPVAVQTTLSVFMIAWSIATHCIFVERGDDGSGYVQMGYGSSSGSSKEPMPTWVTVVGGALSAAGFAVSVGLLVTAQQRFASSCAAMSDPERAAQIPSLPGCAVDFVGFARFEHALRSAVDAALSVLFAKSAFRAADVVGSRACCR